MQDMNIGSWFISQIEKKSPNHSLNIVWFSESVLMALCTFQRGTVRVKNVNLKYWIRYILHRCTWRCGFYRQLKKKVYFSPFWSGLLGIASNLTLNFKKKE